MLRAPRRHRDVAVASRGRDRDAQRRGDHGDPAGRGQSGRPRGRAVDGAAVPDAHPYGRRAKGSVEVVEPRRASGSATPRRAVRAERADGRRRRRRRGARACVETAGAHFGGWRRRPAGAGSAAARRRRPPERRRLVIPMMNKAQADIAYGFTTIARADPAYYAFWLMNNVLGQYAHRRPAWATASASGRGWRTTSRARSMRTWSKVRW